MHYQGEWACSGVQVTPLAEDDDVDDDDSWWEFVLGANQFGFQAGQTISRAEQIDSKLLYLFLMNYHLIPIVDMYAAFIRG